MSSNQSFCRVRKAISYFFKFFTSILVKEYHLQSENSLRELAFQISVVCWCQIKAHLLTGQQWGYYFFFPFYFLFFHNFLCNQSYRCVKENYSPSLFFAHLSCIQIGFSRPIHVLFHHFVCSAAFLVCSIISSQLISGP